MGDRRTSAFGRRFRRLKRGLAAPWALSGRRASTPPLYHCSRSLVRTSAADEHRHVSQLQTCVWSSPGKQTGGAQLLDRQHNREGAPAADVDGGGESLRFSVSLPDR